MGKTKSVCGGGFLFKKVRIRGELKGRLRDCRNHFSAAESGFLRIEGIPENKNSETALKDLILVRSRSSEEGILVCLSAKKN